MEIFSRSPPRSQPNRVSPKKPTADRNMVSPTVNVSENIGPNSTPPVEMATQNIKQG